MEWWQYGLVAFAGLWAGVINSIAGSGTLVTFPVLLSLGFAPVSATMTNAVGLSVGGLSGVYGYRRELRGQGRRIATLLPLSLAGAVGGAALLLTLPADAFETIVPVLVILSLVLVVLQPSLQRRLRARAERRPEATGGPDGPDGPDGSDGSDGPDPQVSRRTPLGASIAVLLVGVYGGYFTAAQGIMLVGFLGLLLTETLQRLNALKNVLATGVNLVAAAVYGLVGGDQVVWRVALVITTSSLVGGWLGSRYGRRLPAGPLRAIIVVVGLVAVVLLVLP